MLTHSLKAFALCLVLMQHGSALCQEVEITSAAHDWVILPGERVGPIDSATTHQDLVGLLGSERVVRQTLELGEGFTESGTVIYPDDPIRRAEVRWRDTVAFRFPRRVTLRGDSSNWVLPNGVSLGTNLHRLELLNGKPFLLAGFGWDYSGVITSWRGGAMETILPGTRIDMYLLPDPAHFRSDDYHRVVGDRDYSSGHPSMQVIDPHVQMMHVEIGKP